LPTGMLNISTQLAEFISNHSADDPARIRLAGKEICGYSANFVADQIEARQLYRKRFPRLCADTLTIFPPKLNLEQSSSEATADAKADFMLQETGRVHSIIDLSAGFGVDALAMSSISDKIVLTEPDEKIRAVAEANFARLIPGKYSFYPLPAEEFLNSFKDSADWIYLDPSRRKSGRKVYGLEDSSPDPVALTDQMLNNARNVLVKTSPMLDIAEVIRKWSCIKNILIVSVSNECREVLYHLSAESQNEPMITCINIRQDKKEVFSFRQTEESSSEVQYSDPLKYIFEPNASVLKAGAFRLIAGHYGIFKLAPHTHLYTSEKIISDFPGRIFEMIRPLEKSDSGIKANIISRNHPMTTDDIASKFKVKDGGDDFIIAGSGQLQKFLLLTRKINKD